MLRSTVTKLECGPKDLSCFKSAVKVDASKNDESDETNLDTSVESSNNEGFVRRTPVRRMPTTLSQQVDAELWSL